MTLSFDTTEIKLQSRCFGCLQTLTDPSSFVFLNQKLPKCKKCNSYMFPVNGNKKIECPFCTPNSDFGSDTYKVPTKSKQKRNNFIFIFDILLPFPILTGILNEIYDVLDTIDIITIVFVTNNLIYLSVSDEILYFHVVNNEKEIKNLKNIFLKKSDLINFVIPSIPSLYALLPSDIDMVCNPFDVLIFTLELIKSPSITMLFLERKISDLNVSKANDIGEMFCRYHSVLHVGSKCDFKKLTAITNQSMGTVFSMECFYGIIHKLYDISKIIYSFHMYIPTSVEFVKVSGCRGKIHKTTYHSALVLQNFVGGAIQMKYNNDNEPAILRIIEIIKTQNGKFITIHTLNNSKPIKIDKEIHDTIALKFFASDITRNVWKGIPMERIMKNKINIQIQEIIKNSSLTNIMQDEQIDILRLYYILLNNGIKNIENKIQKINNEWLLIVPPLVYVFSESGNSDLTAYDIFKETTFPFSFYMINKMEEFEAKLKEYQINFKIP